jgi:hypothetical protein
MNTKHLACILLFAVVLGLFQGTLMLHKRMISANEALTAASDGHTMASNARSAAENNLAKQRKDTAAHRKFLEMWRPKLEATGNEGTAKVEFNRLLKRFPTLVTFLNSTGAPAQNKDMSYINRRIASNVKLEGDAEKAMVFLSSIERDLPTSRIQELEIRKGQRANDVELTVSVETPLLPAPAPVK